MTVPPERRHDPPGDRCRHGRGGGDLCASRAAWPRLVRDRAADPAEMRRRRAAWWTRACPIWWRNSGAGRGAGLCLCRRLPAARRLRQHGGELGVSAPRRDRPRHRPPAAGRAGRRLRAMRPAADGRGGGRFGQRGLDPAAREARLPARRRAARRRLQAWRLAGQRAAATQPGAGQHRPRRTAPMAEPPPAAVPPCDAAIGRCAGAPRRAASSSACWASARCWSGARPTTCRRCWRSRSPTPPAGRCPG